MPDAHLPHHLADAHAPSRDPAVEVDGNVPPVRWTQTPPPRAPALCRTATVPHLLADAYAPSQVPASAWMAALHLQGRVGAPKTAAKKRPPFLRPAHPIPALPPISMKDLQGWGVRPGASGQKASSGPPGRPPHSTPARPSGSPPPGARTVRTLAELSPTRRPGSCPPLAPAGAALPHPPQGERSHKRPFMTTLALLRHSPPPAFGFT